ncbi:MAG TPA: HD domain-containing phosphohydrolase [Vicinamibacterales bacterium]|nr:HD domain-containing phosphohydrolase [Vicinamibacterales bacterium]
MYVVPDSPLEPVRDFQKAGSQSRSGTGVASPKGKVLLVDDLPASLRLIERWLSMDGYDVLKCHDGAAALAAVAEHRPDVVLMDVHMPGITGIEACHQIKMDPSTRLTPVILMTGVARADDRIRAIDAGADDFLTKPVDAQELRARVRSLIRLKRYTDDLDSAEAIILSLALTVEARDPYTDGHCQRLAQYAVALGRRLGLTDEDLSALHRGGYLHDIGKIAIPDAILLKRGKLTSEEYTLMKTHPVVGDRLCGNLRALDRVRPIVRHHHERLDGSGYPDGLRGDSIPLLAQIVGIVDVYDALTTIRPYKKALSSADALDVLSKEAAIGWRDRHLVDTFIECVKSGDVDNPIVEPH